MSSPPAGKQSDLLLVVGSILGLLVPVAGLIIAVILFATGRPQQGGLVLVATLLGALIAAAIYL